MQAAAQVFAPFEELNPFHITDYTTPAWMTAKVGFEAKMSPIERRISQQLQEVLRTTVLPALSAAVAQHADRASAAVVQPSQASLARLVAPNPACFYRQCFCQCVWTHAVWCPPMLTPEKPLPTHKKPLHCHALGCALPHHECSSRH